MNQKGSSAKGPKAGRGKKCESSPQTNTSKTINEVVEQLGNTFIRSFFEMMSAFGLGGSLVLILLWFMSIYASEEQKREMIDKWIIIQSEEDVKTVGIVVILLGIMVVVGQWRHYRKRMGTKDTEIARLKTENTAYKKVIERLKIKDPKQGVKK